MPESVSPDLMVYERDETVGAGAGADLVGAGETADPPSRIFCPG